MRKAAVVISLTLTFSVLTAPSAFAVVPTVDSFTPTSGPVGTSVVITGTGFTGTTDVTFNGTSATTFTVDSDTTITATVPAGATTGPIEVTNPDGTGTSATNFTVTTPTPPPNITGFSPQSGPVGTRVIVTGTNFTDVLDVRLRGRSVNFMRLSSTRIRFRVPLGARSGRITVQTQTGSDTTNVRFIVRKDRHRSVIKLRLRKHLVASGSVRATDGTRMCRSRRRVIVQRRQGGSWRAVRSTRTRPRGRFRVRLPDRPGTYRAIVRKKATLRDLCSADTSGTRRHRHPTGGDGGGGGGGGNCHPSYPDHCIPPPPPDLDCSDVPWTNFRVVGSDPHGFDGDNNGRGCET
jgi:IPT/TIG domain